LAAFEDEISADERAVNSTAKSINDALRKAAR